ncbi:39S ribosomal protein L38, mitochondrial-like [Carassius auratus]|uniref:39S ribosomal protein L38, mitochondrial-like n=1 Tax=Carassius auratus TaxID=7957 RepID=A0A6P6NIW9_CARAU|nr:39S ribosomal protein L38, mitochondrial-like [Carassius auratus]
MPNEDNRKDVWWKTYREYREEKNKEATEPVNIGLPYQRPFRKTEVKERKKVMLENTNNPEMERDNRLRTYKTEPVFEYNRAPVNHPQQKKYPH